MNSTEFPSRVDKVVKKFARDFKLLLRSTTHYDTENRVLVWYEKNIKKRIDLTFSGDSISVTFYCNVCYCCSRLLGWCNNNIPYFPVDSKIKWERLDLLSVGENDEYYYGNLKKYFNYAVKWKWSSNK